MPTTDKRPLKVFLCHADVDNKAVRALYDRLVKDGVDAWLDKENILPGQAWDYEIRKAVREADAVLVCLSKQFNQAGYRQKEVRLALDPTMEKPEGDIFIIPARLEECETLESLRVWNWVNLFEADGYDKLIRALKVQADKVGATIKSKRRGKSKPAALPAGSDASRTSAPSGGVEVGGNVSGSVVVTGSGNIINVNQPPIKGDER
ncbi:MAG TPA: toll/interleukin-1 receptor domain-containing protein [Anaerolineales bacterium]|nr:toll/interleukin-1 receptor domain-containing protein [Anaerolineales bacterium]